MNRLLPAVLSTVAIACSPTPGDGVMRTDPLRLVDEQDVPYEGTVAVRGVAVYDGLRLQVAVAVGPAQITLTTDQNLFDDIEGQLDDEGVLTIETTDSIDPTVGLIEITTPQLEFLAARGDDTSAQVLDVAADRFGLAASEGADVEVTGTCDRLVLVASNGAVADASGLACADGTIDAQGGSTIDAQLSTSVNVTASGESIIRITGSPGEVQDALTDNSTLTVE